MAPSSMACSDRCAKMFLTISCEHSISKEEKGNNIVVGEALKLIICTHTENFYAVTGRCQKFSTRSVWLSMLGTEHLGGLKQAGRNEARLGYQ